MCDGLSGQKLNIAFNTKINYKVFYVVGDNELTYDRFEVWQIIETGDSDFKLITSKFPLTKKSDTLSMSIKLHEYTNAGDNAYISVKLMNKTSETDGINLTSDGFTVFVEDIRSE